MKSNKTRKPNKLNRRTFVRNTGIIVTGMMLGCSKDDDDDDDNMPDPTEGEGLENYTSALVIGSGFGGAVSALRLGQAGVQTTVLERGKWWPIRDDGDTFSPLAAPDQRSSWLTTESIGPIGITTTFEKYTGVLERIRFPGMDTYMGSCVGGGSVVYGGITIAPDDGLFAQVFPSEIDLGALKSTYFPRVQQMMGAVPIPDDLLNDSEYFQFVRTGVSQAENIGLNIEYFSSVYDWDIIKEEIAGTKVAAAIKGEILYGVNSGAKKSLDQNYLPAAEATGNVTIKALHQVDTIEQIEDGYYKVAVQLLNETGDVTEEKIFHCKYLFMGAGSVGTTRLLMRSRELGLLPNINETLGEGWGTNGATMGIRSGLSQLTGDNQSSPSSSAAYDFANAVAPTVLDMANLPTGFECSCLIHLGLTLDPTRGRFTYNPASNDIDLDWPGSTIPRDALADVFNRLNAANGGEIGNFFLPDIKDDLTYHPLGGAVMGQTCDFTGRVFGHENLYVMDGAFIPGSAACANPSLTIAGIAEMNIEKIIAEDIA